MSDDEEISISDASVLRVQVTLGDFRRLTANLPDDTALFIEAEDCWDFHEVSGHIRYFPPALNAPGAVTLSGGQVMDEEHHLIPRFDVWLEYGSRRAADEPLG